MNADLSEYRPYFLTKYFRGPYSDYQPMWYSQVGHRLVEIMLINSINPYISLGTTFAIPWVMRMLDSKGRGFPTKKTNMAAYKELYGGKDYIIHYKLSGLLNVIFVTFMYGSAIPILFPIASFYLFNSFICERLIVAWAMKLPPILDDQLNNFVLDVMQVAPILFLLNAAWMYSNPQIFLE